MFQILDIDGIDMTQPVTNKSALEIIQEEIEQDIQAHRAQDLFDKMIREGKRKNADNVAKLMLYKFGIDVSND